MMILILIGVGLIAWGVFLILLDVRELLDKYV